MPLKHDANVLPLGVLERVLVVLHIARLRREDGVIAADVAVLAGEPERAALAEDDVAWDDILFCGKPKRTGLADGSRSGGGERAFGGVEGRGRGSRTACLLGS